MVFEREIIDLVGLQTYKAFLVLFPNLYQKQYNDRKNVDPYYIQMIQKVITITQISAQELRNQLVLAVERSQKGEDISQMSISSLFNLSPSPLYYPAPFATNAWWFLFISLLIILLLVIIIWIVQGFYPDIKILTFVKE